MRRRTTSPRSVSIPYSSGLRFEHHQSLQVAHGEGLNPLFIRSQVRTRGLDPGARRRSSQSLIRQVSGSNQAADSGETLPRGLNPLFVRSQVRTSPQTQRERITESQSLIRQVSGSNPGPEIQAAHRALSQSLIRQVSGSNRFRWNQGDDNHYVSIPYSSGLRFEPAPSGTHLPGTGLNPLFVRSQVRTLTFGEKVKITGLNPLFVRSQVRTQPESQVHGAQGVSIPYSSGLRFERRSSMSEFQWKCLNPLFVRSQVRTRPEWKRPQRSCVSIPYSSGLRFEQRRIKTWWTSSWSQSLIRQVSGSNLMAGEESDRAASQSLIRQVSGSNNKWRTAMVFKMVSIPYSSGLRFELSLKMTKGGYIGLNPLFVRSQVRTPVGYLPQRKGLRLNPLFVRSQVRTRRSRQRIR